MSNSEMDMAMMVIRTQEQLIQTQRQLLRAVGALQEYGIQVPLGHDGSQPPPLQPAHNTRSLGSVDRLSGSASRESESIAGDGVIQSVNDGARTPASEPTSSIAQVSTTTDALAGSSSIPTNETPGCGRDSLDAEVANTVGGPRRRTEAKELPQNHSNASTIGQSIPEVIVRAQAQNERSSQGPHRAANNGSIESPTTLTKRSSKSGWIFGNLDHDGNPIPAEPSDKDRKGKKRKTSNVNPSSTKGKGELSAPLKTGPPNRRLAQANPTAGPSRPRVVKKTKIREMEAGPSEPTAAITTTVTSQKDAPTSVTATSKPTAVRVDPARTIRDGTSTRRLNESTSANKTAITPTAQGTDSPSFPIGKPRGVVKTYKSKTRENRAVQRSPDSQTSSTAINDDHPLLQQSSLKRPQVSDGSGITDERPKKRPRRVTLVPYVLIAKPVDPTWVFCDVEVSQKATTEDPSMDEAEQLVSDILHGDCPELTDSEDDNDSNVDDGDGDDDGSEVDQLASDNEDDSRSSGLTESPISEPHEAVIGPNRDEPPIEILLPLAEDGVTMSPFKRTPVSGRKYPSNGSRKRNEGVSESLHTPKKVPRRHYSASPTRLPRAFDEDDDEEEDDEDEDEDNMNLTDWARSHSPTKPQSLSLGRPSKKAAAASSTSIDKSSPQKSPNRARKPKGEKLALHPDSVAKRLLSHPKVSIDIDCSLRGSGVTKHFVLKTYPGRPSSTAKVANKTSTGSGGPTAHNKNEYLFFSYQDQPEAPREPGHPGLMTSISEVDEWKGGEEGKEKVVMVFARMSKVKRGEVLWVYMGDYTILHSDSLTPDEFRSLNPEVKNAWARRVWGCGNKLSVLVYARITLRERTQREPSSIETAAEAIQLRPRGVCHSSAVGATAESVIKAFESGVEEIHTYVMKFLKYDQDFHKDVVEAYRNFGPTRPKPRARAPGAGAGDVRRPSNPKNRVRERAASSIELESEDD